MGSAGALGILPAWGTKLGVESISVPRCCWANLFSERVFEQVVQKVASECVVQHCGAGRTTVFEEMP